ncbi:MAG TPA: IclR family transcriptional regulator [Acidimicrobiales bacterium]|jgi:DNA-binding IclR family transcriptional regulator|nr:IclR family transcriptional regulator [Acidimicrobiales bacterium]
MESVSGVGVLDKAVTILQAVAGSPASLAELMSRTGLPRATVHRLGAALELHGLLRRDGAGRYELGLGLVSLGQAASERFPLVELARPVLDELRTVTGESVQLFVREGAQRRCVVSLESPHGLRWIVPQGSVLPLDVGSAGRVLSGEVSRQGWVQSVGEREAGVASVSAPVVGAEGSTVAALSVSGPIERLTRQPGRRFGSAVVAAADRVSSLLG